MLSVFVWLVQQYQKQKKTLAEKDNQKHTAWFQRYLLALAFGSEVGQSALEKRQMLGRRKHDEAVSLAILLSLTHTHSLFFFISITFTLSKALKLGLEAWMPTLAWAVQISARPQSSGPLGLAGRSWCRWCRFPQRDVWMDHWGRGEFMSEKSLIKCLILS